MWMVLHGYSDAFSVEDIQYNRIKLVSFFCWVATISPKKKIVYGIDDRLWARRFMKIVYPIDDFEPTFFYIYQNYELLTTYLYMYSSFVVLFDIYI